MDESTRFLILSLDNGRYAIPITRLLEIAVPREIRKDAGQAGMFEGKYEFRGKSIPVLNIKKNFKLQGGPGTALLVVNTMKSMLGILVDAVTEIIDTDQKPVPIPPGVLDSGARYFRGILRHKGDLILLLNEDGLLQ